MALNTSKCNYLTPLRFKGLKVNATFIFITAEQQLTLRSCQRSSIRNFISVIRKSKSAESTVLRVLVVVSIGYFTLPLRFFVGYRKNSFIAHYDVQCSNLKI